MTQVVITHKTYGTKPLHTISTWESDTYQYSNGIHLFIKKKHMHDQTFEKISFLEKFPEHYLSSVEHVQQTKTQKLWYMSITHEWDFDEKIFDDSIKVLQWLAFTMKFSFKRNPPPNFFDYNIPPVEVIIDKKSRIISLPQPEYITAEKVLHGRRVAQAKSQWKKLPQVDFTTKKSNKVIQITHIWPYDWLPETIKKIEAHAKKENIDLSGTPTYVYLNDLRRTKPDALETIIRIIVK